MPGPASKAPTGVPSKAMPVPPGKGGSGKGKGKHRSAESAAQGSQPRSSGSQPSSSGSQPTSSDAQKRVQGVSVWDIVQVQAPHEGPAQLKLPPWWPKDDGRGKTRTYRRRGVDQGPRARGPPVEGPTLTQLSLGQPLPSPVGVTCGTHPRTQ